MIFQRALVPDQENHWVDEQFEQAARDDAANHWRGDALHDVGASLRDGRPHDRQWPERDRASGHDFRTIARRSHEQ